MKMPVLLARHVRVIVASIVCCSALSFPFNTAAQQYRVRHAVTRLNISEEDAATDADSSPTGQDETKTKTLNPFRLGVLRMGLTEPAWTSSFNYQKKNGAFNCAYCGQGLFDASAKYDSGSGWPSFWRSDGEGVMTLKKEWDGRMECKCSKCESHLGHVFMDGPSPSDMNAELVKSIPSSDPKGRNSVSRLPRFCMNGAAMTFDEDK